MRFDEIDEALRRQPAWDPPAGFSRRVAAIAVREPRGAVMFTSPLTLARQTLGGLMSSCSATVGGYAWMLRQYWALLAR